MLNFKSFRLEQNCEEDTEISHLPPTNTYTELPPNPITIPHQGNSFVIISEYTMVHHYHPKSIIYIRIYSWCYTFYGFGQMYA